MNKEVRREPYFVASRKKKKKKKSRYYKLLPEKNVLKEENIGREWKLSCAQTMMIGSLMEPPTGNCVNFRRQILNLHQLL